MADEKKEEKKPEAWVPGTVGQVFGEVAGLLVLILVIGILLNALTGIFNISDDSTGGSIPWYERFTDKGRLIAHSKPLSSIENPIGMRVASIRDNDVYDSPGGKKIGSHKFGDAGRVIQGPVEVDGVKYWYVDYDIDPDGWVKEDDVRSLTTPVSTVEDPVGRSVMNTTESNVLDDYGSIIGKHQPGDRGVIKKGPKYINGEKYWYVDYENGPDGWVKESDIGLVEEDSVLDKFAFKVLGLLKYFRYVAYLFALVCLGGIAYLWIRIDTIRKAEINKYYPEVVDEDSSRGNIKWQRVLDLSESLNESDWRLAIIEADILLAELLESMNLSGETIGDKLKKVERADFLTLDNAWEAHKMRNAIAHQGTNFLLNQRESKRVIALYQSVFEEFKVI